MHAGRGLKSTTAITAACLFFSLGVAGCTTVPGGPAGAAPESAAPLPTVSVSPPAASPSAAPVASSPSTPGTPSAAGPASLIPAPASSSPDSSSPGPAVPAPSAAVSTTPAPSAAAPTQPRAAVEPSPEPGTSAPEPAETGTVMTVDASGPAVYYVAIDDGGSRGVRFGCNDSLVPVRGMAVPGDPLTVALGRLLEAGMPVDSDAALYDALAGSSLRYLSGYMSGATVVVNLSGSLRPGGVCDIPRIQAQLTQTIVAASGASRAEIYVNGRTLTEALSVR
ncbi:GerMN domain-containing protein [Arthrobacter sp. YN]|uniref:GerMN domain-containing protein n=1 Tax=Arthrobacter sp. YN TaxID=2020486 RepID=UPI000B5DEC20|nr:GerMN domain-containing protein [Arthrobacter sp. YN]ASN21971.1 hypothetical protein CGK93_21615 [Arthrobacter sp. YN]